ncbi:MAG: YihY/virulence factor BrkB family protein, partial [Geminicoccaceae bacterium]
MIAHDQQSDRPTSYKKAGRWLLAFVQRQALVLWLASLHMLDGAGTLLAGHIAFTTLFALFPFLIFLTALAGELGQSGAAQTAIEYGLGSIPDEVRAAIEPAVNEVLKGGRQGLMTISIVASLWAVSSAVEAARYALNLAYDVKRTRAIWWQRLQSLVMVLTFAICIIIAMIIVIAAPFAWALAEFFDLQPMDWWTTYSMIRFGLSVVLMIGFVVPLYR